MLRETMAAYPRQMALSGDLVLTQENGHVIGIPDVQNYSRQIRELDDAGVLDHCLRTGELTARIVGYLGGSYQDVADAKLAGLIHDYLKRDELFKKKGSFTYKDSIKAKKHAREIVSVLPWLNMHCAKAACGHHDERAGERRTRLMTPDELYKFIGDERRADDRRTNDPDGGLMRRTLTLADVFDSLTSDDRRHYREPVSGSRALEVIEKEFDFPEISALRDIVGSESKPLVIGRL